MPCRRIARAVLALALVLTAPVGARAHAVLLGSEPADGARVDGPPPAEVVLRFNEPVRPVAVRVLGPTGAEVAGSDAVSVVDEAVRVALPPALAPGSYLVSYRVTSADGHPVAGSLAFGLGAAAAATAPRPGPARDQDLLAALAAVNRAAHYGALLTATGGVLFLLLILGRPHPLENRLRDGLCGLIAVAAATGALAVGLAGAQLAGTPLASLAASTPWAVGIATSLGGSAAAASGGLLLLALGLALHRRRLGSAAMALGCLLALSSLTLTGHAATAPPRVLSVPAVCLHALAAAYWVGSLWPLAVALRVTPGKDAYDLVRRFSRLAVAAVAALLAAGVALSVVQLGSPAAVLGSRYGQVWLAKLGLVVLLLGLAGLNRRVLTPRLIRPTPDAAAGLRRSIAAELILVAGIIAATALLGQTPPPRAMTEHGHVDHAPGGAHHDGHAAGPGAYATTATTAQGYTARLEVAPAEPGRNRVTVTLADAAGHPVAAHEVTVALSLPEAGIEPLARILEPAGAGRYVGEAEFPLPGRWEARIDALIGDFEKAILRAEVPIGHAGDNTRRD